MAKGIDQAPPATVRTDRPVMETDESAGNLIQLVVEQINKEGSASSLKEVKHRLKDQFQMIYSFAHCIVA
ncbi:hypothetical protein BGX24_000772 [Mortierella sp. AD032]|nr:hypothetical protein BGX24_000772 [Mortierella sp. AD032]